MSNRQLVITPEEGNAALVQRLAAVQPQAIAATAIARPKPGLVSLADIGAEIIARWPDDCLRHRNPERVSGAGAALWRRAIAQYHGLSDRLADFERLCQEMAWRGVAAIEGGGEQAVRALAREFALPEVAALHCAQQYEIQKILSNRFDDADALNLPRRALDTEAGRRDSYQLDSLVICEADRLSPAELALGARLARTKLVLVAPAMSAALERFASEHGASIANLCAQPSGGAADALSRVYQSTRTDEQNQEDSLAPGQ